MSYVHVYVCVQYIHIWFNYGKITILIIDPYGSNSADYKFK